MIGLIAMTLLDDPIVPTHYLPIRSLVKCLEKGNINLAINLYYSPDNQELRSRATGLLNELILGNKQLLAQINETNHLLCIITFIKNLDDLKELRCSISEMQNKILRDFIEQTKLDTILGITLLQR